MSNNSLINQQIYAKRRQILLNKLPENSLVIIASGKQKQRNSDVFYPFRASSDFLYLLGLNQPDVIAIFAQDTLILFLQERNKKQTIWQGNCLGIKEALNQFVVLYLISMEKLWVLYSSIYSRTGGFMGLSFAIPTELAIYVVEQLKDKGFVTRGLLGIGIQKITRELLESLELNSLDGALVSSIMPDTAAEEADIEIGDIIIEYDGIKIDNIGRLTSLVARTKPGKEVMLLVLRNGKKKEVQTTIRELPQDEDKDVQLAERKELNLDVEDLGLIVREMGSEEKKKLDEDALIIEKVKSGPARQAGLQSGDLLLMINNKRVHSISELEKIVEELPRGKFVTVLIMRGDTTRFFALKVPEE